MQRFWRFLKLGFFAVIGIVGVLLICLAVANGRANARINKKIAELRAAGQPVALADLARKTIPPDTNAATYLRRAKSDLDGIEKIIATAWEVELRDTTASDEAIERGEPMMRAYRQAVATYPTAWPLLEKASQCPDFDPLLDFSTDTQTFIKNLLPIVQAERAAIRALRYRALVQLADGKREEAFNTCLSMLRLADHFDRNPAMTGFLVGIAVRSVAIDVINRVVRSGPLAPVDYEALERELARQDLTTLFQRALATERALGIQTFGEYRVQTGYMKLPSGKYDQLSYLELFETAIQNAANLNRDEQALARITAILDRSGPLTNLGAPALKAVSDAVARCDAKCRTLRVLNAILRREQAGNSVEPKLADLGLPAEATTDPFNGQPLVLKKTPDGWLIYSVGHNLIDDDGKLDNGNTDVGLGPIKK